MESVERIRGATRDENDAPVPGTSVPLFALAVSPGSSLANKDRGRNGAKVAYTVYFWPAADLQDGDKIKVRGTTCDVVILDWRSPYTGRRGLEVLCSAGRG